MPALLFLAWPQDLVPQDIKEVTELKYIGDRAGREVVKSVFGEPGVRNDFEAFST